MRILALETTELIGGVAAMDGRNLLADFELSRQQRTAQSLAPGVRSLLGQVRWQPSDVELVAVTVGPGSFTGLRIGVTTAKVFAYAAGADILGIDTLETIAAGAPEQVQAVTAIVDAQRGEAVVRSFVRDEDGWFRPIAAAELVEVDVWLERLPSGTTISALEFVAGQRTQPLDRVAQDDFGFITTAMIPEPATMGLLAMGAVGLLARRRRK